MIQGALFDMDGLMFDTERVGTLSWAYAAQKFGINFPSEMIEAMRGVNREDCRILFNRTIGGDPDFDTVHDIRSAWQQGWVAGHGVPVKPGLCELLDWLKHHGVKIALATSTRPPVPEQYLKAAGVFNYFDELVFGNMVANGKPHPDIFLLAAKKIGVPPQNTIVLEDSGPGITAAADAGARPVLVPDLCKISKEVENRCAAVCSTLLEVRDRLQAGTLLSEN